MTGPVNLERRGAVLVCRIEHPPVNSLAHAVRLGLWAAVETADADEAVKALLITGSGRGFSAGGEYSELATPLNGAHPALSNHLFPRIEAMRKPAVAALHGFAMGGGLELAMACHYRVAQRGTKVALPEVKHGLIPPSGSQRLPRAVGVERALALMVPAATLRAAELSPEAGGAALFDSLCDDDVLNAALAFIEALEIPVPVASVLLRHRRVSVAGAAASLARWRARLAADSASTKAMCRCVDAVEYAVEAADFETGLRSAKRLYDELQAGLSSQHS